MARKYRKQRQKIKRYRRSFYSREVKLRRGIGIALAAAVILAAAWFAAPHVLDWATHTWYTHVRGRDLEAEASSAAAAASSQEAAASSIVLATPEPTPTPEPEIAARQTAGTAVLEGSWASVDVAALTGEDAIRTEAQRLAGEGVTYALVTLKDSNGHIYYASSLPAAAASIADTTVDAQAVASIFKENGLIPVACLTAFRDPTASYTDRSMAIHYRSNGETDYLWLDAASTAGGKAWLNPYSTAAVEFIGDLVAEVHELGFDHVALRCVQFPASVSSKQDYGSTGGVSRAGQLSADIAAWQTRFGDAVTLWLAYSPSQCTGAPSELGASAVELGMQNLLLETSASSPLDSVERTAIEQAAAAAGVQHVMETAS